MSIEELCAGVCTLGPTCGLEPLLRETVAEGGRGLEILLKVAHDVHDTVEGDTNGYYNSEESDSFSDSGTDSGADSESESGTDSETNSETEPEDFISDEDVEDTLKEMLPHGHRHGLRAQIRAGVEQCGAFRDELSATRQRRAEEDEVCDREVDTDTEDEKTLSYDQEMLEYAEDDLVRVAHETGLDLGGLAAAHITYGREVGIIRGPSQDSYDLSEVEEMIEALESGLEERDAAAARVEAMLDQLPSPPPLEVAAAAAAASHLLDDDASSTEALHGAAQDLRAAILAVEARAPDHERAAMKRSRADYESVVNIREEQRSVSAILNARDFNHVLRAVGTKFTPDFRCTPEAADAFRVAAEDYLVELFRDSGRVAIHAQRTYVQPKDMCLVRNLRRDPF
jgi:histone H3/H4